MISDALQVSLTRHFGIPAGNEMIELLNYLEGHMTEEKKHLEEEKKRTTTKHVQAPVKKSSLQEEHERLMAQAAQKVQSHENVSHGQSGPSDPSGVHPHP